MKTLLIAAASLSLAAAAPAVSQGVAPPPAPVLAAPPPLPLFGAPTPRQDRWSDACRSDDMVCRIDALERRVAELERDGPRGGGGGRRDRGVEMAVGTDCIWESCQSIATRLCSSAGFKRGVATEIGQDGMYQRLDKATCFD